MLNTTKNNEKLMIVIFYSWHIYLFITVEKIYNNKLCVKVFIGYILLDSKALARQKKAICARTTTTFLQGLNSVLAFESYACVNENTLW